MLLKIAVKLLLLYIAICGLLFAFQRSMLFFPTPASGLHVDLVESLSNDVGEFKYWVVNSKQKDAIVYFGGNAEAVEFNIDGFARMFADKAVYFMAYRGYGDSDGAPSEAAIYDDAKSLYQLVKSRHDNVSVIGRSLGSGVASRLASEHEVQQLILITSFDSIQSVAQSKFKVFPLALLMRDKFLSEKYAPKIEAPTLLVIAADDKVIPPKHALRLAESFRPGLATVEVLAGADHNNISAHPQYESLLADAMRGTEVAQKNN